MRDEAFGKPEPSDEDDYVKFFREFGSVLKEGLAQDWTHRERLADLMLYQSTKTRPGQYTTLAKYVERLLAWKS